MRETLPPHLVITEARRWVGTPYVHQASRRGAGTDCLGLVRGLWRSLLGPEPEALPAYSPDWAERTGQDTLLEALLRHFILRDARPAEPGDVLLFRMRTGGPARHCAILASPTTIIHAWQGRAVAETPFAPFWQRRLCAAAAFPAAHRPTG